MTHQDADTRPGLVRLTSSQGKRVVYLPLEPEGFAVMNEPDADRLLAAGVPLDRAHLAAVGDGLAHVAVPSARPDLLPVVFLARLLTGTGPRRRIRYRNKDATDLRRGNLQVMERRTLAEQHHQEGSGDLTQ